MNDMLTLKVKCYHDDDVNDYDDDDDDEGYADLEGHCKERHKEVGKGKTHLIQVFFKDLGDFNAS